MAKEKAMSTLLKEANQKIEKLEKELASEKNSLSYATKNRDEYQSEIEAIHAALDCLPQAPGRMVKSTGRYGNEVSVSCSARLFAWIATVAFGKNTKKGDDIKDG